MCPLVVGVRSIAEGQLFVGALLVRRHSLNLGRHDDNAEEECTIAKCRDGCWPFKFYSRLAALLAVMAEDDGRDGLSGVFMSR